MNMQSSSTDTLPMRPLRERIFVVGVGRSGTSLVQSILGSHSQIVTPPETHFLRRFVITGELRKVHQRGGIDAAIGMLTADERLQRLDLDVPAIVHQTTAEDRSFDPLAVYERLIDSYVERESAEASLVLDKDPKLVESLTYLHQNWPTARIVHVVRDPRDVLVSRKKAEWSKDRATWHHALVSAAQFRLGRRSGRKLFGEQYAELVYEQLLADAESESRRLCELVGIPFEADMLQFQKTASKIVSQDERAWKEETTGPLLKSNSGKWMKELEPWEIALTERTCQEVCDAIGYERVSKMLPIGLFQRLKLSGMSLSLRAASEAYSRLAEMRKAG